MGKIHYIDFWKFTLSWRKGEIMLGYYPLRFKGVKYSLHFLWFSDFKGFKFIKWENNE